ncbi:MAG: DNA-binding transcriptional regulator Fis [Gammaproteobacteria bacterium]|nr:DNA-binding transcriptional regulator Fis [Gammaproteobacteria bacterium]
MLDEIFGADEDSGGIDLPAFAPARLQEAETLRASLNLETLRPAGVSTLREQVLNSVENYFALLEGEQAKDLYELVLAEVEAPLLAAVMHQTRGNQSKAAIVLGLNRGTLRTKLKQYGLL